MRKMKMKKRKRKWTKMQKRHSELDSSYKTAAGTIAKANAKKKISFLLPSKSFITCFSII